MFWLSLAFVIIFGYLIGCLQWSYLLIKLFKKQDIRTLGSQNAGASNTVMNFGWKFGIIVAFLDIVKGTLAVWLVRSIPLFAIYSIDERFLLAFVAGIMVVIGHIYPFYMQFKGGKGTASGIGMMLAFDWRIALLGILVIVTITLLTNYIALGAISMWASYGGVAFFWLNHLIITSVLVGMFLLSIYLHYQNLERIYKGTETGLRNVLPKKEGE